MQCAEVVVWWLYDDDLDEQAERLSSVDVRGYSVYLDNILIYSKTYKEYSIR